MRQLIAAALLLVASHSTPVPSNAYGGLMSYQLERDEVALLPEYCRHTQVIIERHGSPADQRAWVDRVGPSFMHMHHYCIALVGYLRSFRQRNSVIDRNGYLQFAWQNFDYVIRNAEPTFALLPEVYYRRGQTAFRQRKLDDARQDLEKAIAGDPRHFRAVYELSQVLVAIGDTSRAFAVLEAGIEQVPESRLLKSAINDLKAAKSKR